MKKLLFVIAFIFSLSGYSQNEEILNRLKEFNLSPEVLTENLKDADAQYYFNLVTTTANGTDTTILNSHFDPSLEIGNRWVLESANGNTPTKKELKSFDKVHNTKTDDINGVIDDSSWKIETDDDFYLIISFKYDKASLPKKYEFLGDCTGKAYFSKRSKRLEKAMFVNNGPLKVKFFKVSKLDMIVYYEWNETSGTYFIEKEDVTMDVKLLGQLVTVEEKNEYSGYKKK